jgi:hypothetical protein
MDIEKKACRCKLPAYGAARLLTIVEAPTHPGGPINNQFSCRQGFGVPRRDEGSEEPADGGYDVEMTSSDEAESSGDEQESANEADAMDIDSRAAAHPEPATAAPFANPKQAPMVPEPGI